MATTKSKTMNQNTDDLSPPSFEGLTEQQNAFIDHLVGTAKNPTDAARRAGYTSPKQAASELLRNPRVISALESFLQARINSDLIFRALNTLEELMEKGSGSVRLGACKAVLEAAGLMDAKARVKELGGQNKQLEEMTIEELQSFIQQGEEFSRMKTVAAQIFISQPITE